MIYVTKSIIDFNSLAVMTLIFGKGMVFKTLKCLSLFIVGIVWSSVMGV